MNRDREATYGLRPGVLADEPSELLTGQLVSAWTAEATPQEQPVAVLVAGQPGAGKTLVGDLAQSVLDRRGRAVRVCSDLYKSGHPDYAALLAADVRRAGAGVRAAVRGCQAAVEEWVRGHRLDAVVETALADAEDVRWSSRAYRAAGHRLELVVLATPPAVSALGILDRYLDGDADGGGRWVSWANHDRCVEAVAAVLAVVEDERLVDRVTVVRRDLTVLFANHLNTGGAWTGPVGLAAAVGAEHRRPWSAAETSVFLHALADSDRRVHRDVADDDRRLAVQRDAARAAALAEPVRRIAQPVSGPPGVAYHRLSAAEFEWTWEELIVPGYLDDITAHDDPVTTYVLGQPGAGKTGAAYLVRRALRHRRAVTISGGYFKDAHPDYARLLEEDPRGAGSRIRTDYTAWQRQAEALVRAERGDMVVEMAPGSVDRLIDGIARDRRAGRRVDLVVLAVRAADSLQGTAARYAHAVRTGPARYTTVDGHDRCLAVLPAAVAAAETAGLADTVTVIRRDHTALYRRQRASGGRPLAATVLLAEQHRPYTTAEAAAFRAVQRTLFAAMPQYREDLAEITARARPYLPARLQPRWLPRATAAGALLPVYPSRSSLQRAS